MCGIAGILDLRNRRRIAPKTLEAMTRAMAHRGPDSDGWFIDDNLGLAHRRLAIIDPTPAGHQPMVGDDGRFVVCFNGTIYNYFDLREILERSGHRFNSSCDTEVLIHGWEEWGRDLVNKLNGHFAFIIWDSRKKQLFLVRDRFGAKPLYYANLGGLWLFASEIKGITAHPAYTPDINYDALCEYFTFQNLFRFHTMFRDVYLLPPANIVRLDVRQNSFQREEYWDFDFSRPEPDMTECEAKRETQRLMVQAVNRQLFSDVPVGSYLSGGMDSGSIVAIASQEVPCIHTFTCGWHMGGVGGPESTFDERVDAEAMAYEFRTQHYEQVIGHTDVTWALKDVVRHLEDLRLGMSYGNYYIARLASKFVKVCLSGTGGDELFGGYPWRYYRISRSLGREEFIDLYYDYWQRLVPDELRPEFFTPYAQGRMTDLDMRSVMARVFTFNNNMKFDTVEDHIANSLYFECKTFLHGLLIVGDRLSMAHGLEERLPFLDNDLVDFARKIPVRHKLGSLEAWKRQDENIWGKSRNYFQEHDRGKNVLRLAMEGFIPEEIRNRKKQGFSSPDESWYRGPNLDFVRDIIMGKKALLHEFIEPAMVERTVREHSQGGLNRRLRIWSLLCFEVWLKIFMEGRSDWLEETIMNQAGHRAVAAGPGFGLWSASAERGNAGCNH